MKKFLLLAFLFLLSAEKMTAQYADSLFDVSDDQRDFLLWQGVDPKMTALEFASYCAPVFWYSPDEPELHKKSGKEVNIPRPYPFQPDSGKPVVYYQIAEILLEKNAVKGFDRNKTNPDSSILDLSKINGVEIDYTHYYEFEKGLGAHRHDNEQVQMKIFIDDRYKSKGQTIYKLLLLEVKAKAHALSWYDNIYSSDTNATEMQLPFHILVEEGKHASCTDVNGDGYYTPGYDVNVSRNDAWGVRDVIRTGDLFTPDYNSYMTKVRKTEHKVLPPLPQDSPYRKKYSRNGVYGFENAVYELRPMPHISKVKDRMLKHDMHDYTLNKWPAYRRDTDLNKVGEWWEDNRLLKSIAVAARFNDERVGVAISFPFLIIKNVETPIIGGWMVNRVYFQDINLRDIGYNLLITPSASRFMDPYFAAGVELNKFNDEQTGELKKETNFVMETGIKLRANVRFSFLKFLSVLTDFWGVRLGIKNVGFMEIKRLSYVFEIGAGVW